MIRRSVVALLAVVVSLGTVLLPSRQILATGERWRSRFRELVAIHLAQTLSAEVSVGRVYGDLLRGFRIENIVVSDGPSFSTGTLASADLVEIKCNALTALRQGAPVLEAVEAVRITGLRGRLVRRKDGTLNIDRWVPKRRPVTRKGPRFRGRVIVLGADISYVDSGRKSRHFPGIEFQLTGLDGTADFKKENAVEVAFSAFGAHAPFVHVQACGSYIPSARTLVLNGAISGGNARMLANGLWHHAMLEVRSGTVDASGNLAVGPNGVIDFCVGGRGYGLNLKLGAPHGQLIKAEGDFFATRAGVRFTRVRGWALGARLVGDATIMAGSTPTLDATIAAENVNANAWGALFPSLRPALDNLSGAENLSAKVRLTGSLSDLDVTLSTDCRPELVLTSTAGVRPGGASPEEISVELTASRAEATVSIPSTKTRDLSAEISAKGVQVADLAPLVAQPDYLTHVRIAPLEQVRTRIVYSRPTRIAFGALDIPEVHSSRGSVKKLHASYALIGPSLWATVAAEEMLGGQVTADCLADLSKDRASIYTKFAADGLHLSELARAIRPKGSDAAGQTDVIGTLLVRGKNYEVSAKVSARSARLSGIHVDTVDAHLAASQEGAELRFATAVGPLGTWWARGYVPWRAPMELEVTAAGIPVAEVPWVVEGSRNDARTDAQKNPQLNAPSPESAWAARGTGFVHGWIRGYPSSPRIAADVAVFNPATSQYGADVATAFVTADRQDIAISNLLARRGTAMASGWATVRNIQWPAGNMRPEQGSAERSSGGVYQQPLDGHVDAYLSVSGLELGEVPKLLEAPRRIRLAGVGGAQLRLTGTLVEPRISARVEVEHVRAADSLLGVAMGPAKLEALLTANRDRVRVERAVLSSSDGTVKLQGEVSGWNSEEGPTVTAQFEGRNLDVAAYTPAEGLAASAEGRIDRVVGEVAGPMSSPWPTVTAQVSAAQLQLLGRPVQGLHAQIGYDHGVVSGTNGSCTMAGGRFEVRAASYRPADGKLFADITASNVEARQLLLFAGDLAMRGRQDSDARAARDRWYSHAHRMRGQLSVHKLAVGGTLDNLEGRVQGLRLQEARLDGRSVPGLTAGFHFAGVSLKPRETHLSPTSEAFGARLQRAGVDDLRVQSDAIGQGVIQVRGGELTEGATLRAGGTVDAVIEADLVPVNTLNDWLPPGLGVGGDLSFTVRAQGDTQSPSITGSLELFHPTIAGMEFDLMQAANVVVEPDAVVMKSGLIKRGVHEVQLEGRLPFNRNDLKLDSNGEVSFEARVDDLPAEVLLQLANEFTARRRRPGGKAPLLERCRANGLLTAWLRIDGKLAKPQITGGVSLEEGGAFRLEDWPRSSILVDLGGDLLLSPSSSGQGAVVEALNVRGRYQGTRLALDGRIDVSHLEREELLKNRIEGLTLTAEATKQAFWAGTVAQDLKAVITARTDEQGRHVVTVREGFAKLGRGTATLTGTFFLDTLSLAKLGHIPCDLRLRLDKAQVRYGRWVPKGQLHGVILARKFASSTRQPLPEWFMAGRRAMDSLDPDVPLLLTSAKDDSAQVRGPIRLTEARLGLPGHKSDALGFEAVDAGRDGRKQLHGLSSRLPTVRLDLALALGPQVDFVTPIAQGRLAEDNDAVRLTGTLQAPELEATATLKSGSLRLLRGNLDIPTAGVQLNIRPAAIEEGVTPVRRRLRLNSRVWGRAQGTISGQTLSGESIGPIRVELELSGGLPPDHVLSTTSRPPLSPEEVYELLALAPLRPGDEVSRDHTQTVDQMIASAIAYRVFSGVLAPLEEELIETLGLEQFEIAVGVNQPLEFRVGKYLVRDLLVSYMRTAGGPDHQYELRVTYQLKKNMQVGWYADERGTNAFAIEYAWRF